jgi:hypothetical protein
MTTESKQRAANIKARREAVGITFAGFYDALNLTEKQGEFVENGQYGKNITEFRIKAEKFLDHLEAKKEWAPKTPHFILPKQAGTGVDLPASRYLIVTREGLSCTKAGELIRNRRGEMGIQREALVCALAISHEQVNLVEAGHYHEQWVNYANKIWDHLDMIERERKLTRPDLYEGIPGLSHEIIKETMTKTVDEILPGGELHVMIKRQREELGIGVRQFATECGVPQDDYEAAESGEGRDASNWSILQRAVDVLTRLKIERNGRSPVEVKRIASLNGKWGWVGVMPVVGASLTFRVLPNNGKEFTKEELAAFPPLDLTPKPAPEYKAHRSMNNKSATQKQLEKFADGLCQSLLKSNRDLVTIPWAEFYEVLYAATGCGHFDQSLLDSIFSNLTCCSIPFLISYGNNVVVVCKDANFAPVEFP